MLCLSNMTEVLCRLLIPEQVSALGAVVFAKGATRWPTLSSFEMSRGPIGGKPAPHKPCPNARISAACPLAYTIESSELFYGWPRAISRGHVLLAGGGSLATAIMTVNCTVSSQDTPPEVRCGVVSSSRRQLIVCIGEDSMQLSVELVNFAMITIVFKREKTDHSTRTEHSLEGGRRNKPGALLWDTLTDPRHCVEVDVVRRALCRVEIRRDGRGRMAAIDPRSWQRPLEEPSRKMTLGFD
ncbi:hypothetical protein V8C26DRAFT_187032 [Trichoderma gracile]